MKALMTFIGISLITLSILNPTVGHAEDQMKCGKISSVEAEAVSRNVVFNFYPEKETAVISLQTQNSAIIATVISAQSSKSRVCVWGAVLSGNLTYDVSRIYIP